MSSRELSEWMAFYKIEPFGDDRADLRQAFTTTLIANAWRGKHGKLKSIRDFMPFVESVQATPQSGIGAKVMAAFKAMAGKQ